MTMILWRDESGEWRRATHAETIGSGADATIIDPFWYAEREHWAYLEEHRIYEEMLEPGSAPLGYNDPVVENHDGRNRAYRYRSGTDQDRANATRQAKADEIEKNRIDADIRQIDYARDPGLQGLLDEVNSLAEAKLVELDATDDADLFAFDSTLNPQDVTAVDSARSLVAQESRLLQDPQLTTEQSDELIAAIAAHQAVVDANDPNADVPAVPMFARLRVGVPVEDYGSIIARRINEAGWWWLTFEMRTERQLDVADYWIAVYSQGTYLTTPRLTQTEPGVYVADRMAVNLPAPDTNTQYEFTLCHKHISNPQFDHVTLLPGVERQRNRARWAGRAG